MAKSTRKLKVFQTRIGFHDTVIATGSMAAALRAWGTKQDLFAQGLAEIVTDEAIIEAASAHPDTPLRRPIGSDEPFSTAAARPRLTDIDPGGVDAPEPEPEAPKPKAKAAKPEPPPPPDRRKLNEAETEYAAIEKEGEEDATYHAREIKEIDDELEKLRARKAALEEDHAERREAWEQRRSEARDDVTRERRAYRAAGGLD